MPPINVMVNGIPGKVATLVAEHICRDARFALVPYALTGPEIPETRYAGANFEVRLVKPDERQRLITEIRKAHGELLSADFTHPTAVNANAVFYCDQGLPFVMGTTGGDRARLEETVQSSSIAAVVAPNMAKAIVGFQAMMAYAAETFPNLFKGYRLSIVESHQQGKADTSGTAKAMVGYFNRLGVAFSEDEIKKERDPAVQRSRWGIPQEYLGGHGWHTYSLVSGDGTVRMEFTHNVNGRDVYAHGTIDALLFLNQKVAQGVKGRMFTMMDVLKGG
jgi:4-hydroxy-tetrahydrodipicolinate reductase